MEQNTSEQIIAPPTVETKIINPKDKNAMMKQKMFVRGKLFLNRTLELSNHGMQRHVVFQNKDGRRRIKIPFLILLIIFAIIPSWISALFIIMGIYQNWKIELEKLPSSEIVKEEPAAPPKPTV